MPPTCSLLSVAIVAVTAIAAMLVALALVMVNSSASSSQRVNRASEDTEDRIVTIVRGWPPETNDGKTEAVPLVLFGFANDRQNDARYLRNLPEEIRRIRAKLRPIVEAGAVELDLRPNVTHTELFDVLQSSASRERLAIFHFGGHATEAGLSWETAAGSSQTAWPGGLAVLLGRQTQLQLVFLNGCRTLSQADVLLDSGVPVAVLTADDIEDEVATLVSERFYAGLAGGADIGTSFDEAIAAARTTFGLLVTVSSATAVVQERSTSVAAPALRGRPGASYIGARTRSGGAFGHPERPSRDVAPPRLFLPAQRATLSRTARKTIVHGSLAIETRKPKRPDALIRFPRGHH